MALLRSPNPALAQRSVTFEVRLGAVASSPLATDSVLRQSTLNRLAGNGHVAEQARATPGVAPTIQVSARTALRENLQLEATGGWSFGKLHAGSDTESRAYQSFNIGSATIGLRYALLPRVHVRGAFGALHYGASAEGLFRQGGALVPVLEAGIGSDVRFSFGTVGIAAFGQTHRFGTAAVRQLGGSDGSVLRGGLLVGFTFGSKR